MPPTSILLVRHGESIWNAAGRWQGHADPPLSENGRRQAADVAVAIASRHADEPVSAVVASDLCRARDTAETIARRVGLEVVVDAALREIDIGSWTGCTRAEIAARDPKSLTVFFEGRHGWTGGESHEEHEARCDAAARSLDAFDSDDGALVVVSHGGTIRALARSLLGIDHGLRARFAGVGHASTTELARGPDGLWRLVSWGAPPTR